VYIAGAVEKLCELLGTNDAPTRALAAAALRPLASLDKACAAMRSAGAVAALVALVGDADVQCRKAAAQVRADRALLTLRRCCLLEKVVQGKERLINCQTRKSK
jgi:hypothetical protein